MSDVRVDYNHVWKKFRIGGQSNRLRQLIPKLFQGGLGPRDQDESDRNFFWSLRDVNFQIREGECVGVIGSNGAGKSTLLKCASRILRPNQGRVSVTGRVSALIEVGAGFHPDLTGRENVYLNGTILGMKRRDITARFDDIVDFAGMGSFIDTPVKRYSSGMFARLGFAVAAFMDPDVLLIDEVLSVGDAAFARRCEKKIRQIVNGSTSVLFVSHDLAAISLICDRVIVLKSGTIAFDGPTDEAIHHYHVMLATEPVDSDTEAPVQVIRHDLGNALGEPTHTVHVGDPFLLEVELRAKEDIEQVSLTIAMKNENDHEIYSLSSEEFTASPINLAAGQTALLRFRFQAQLMPNSYWVGLSVWGARKYGKDRIPRLLAHLPNRLPFTVQGQDRGSGAANLFGDCEIVPPRPASTDLQPSWRKVDATNLTLS